MLISCDVIKAEKWFFDWFQAKTFFSFVEFQMNKTLDLPPDAYVMRRVYV